jgi:hypothetical protein
LELSVCDRIAAREENNEVGDDITLCHVAQLVLKCLRENPIKYQESRVSLTGIRDKKTLNLVIPNPEKFYSEYRGSILHLFGR